MEIKIKNTAIINEANVLLDGLTVIAGENDSGKSTVGKLMFAIVKALNNYEETYIQDKENAIKEAIKDLYIRIREIFDLKDFPELSKAFNPDSFYEEIRDFVEIEDFNNAEFDVRDKFYDILTAKEELLKASVLKKSNKTAESKLEKQDLAIYDICYQVLDKIRPLLYKRELSAAINNSFKNTIFSEFYGEISSKTNDSSSEIDLIENNNKLVEITISKNRPILELIDKHLSFDDVTFVESPIYLQMYDVLRSATILKPKRRTFGMGDRKVAHHVKDLISKLINAQYYIENDETNELLETIEKIVNGDINFEKARNDFSYHKKLNCKSISVRPTNTASGIKSFGIIQLLVKANFLNKRSLLIIDEPETHLHPKWQVEYARLIVELVKHDITVLVTTHSPYMMQALRVFGEQAQLEKQLNFYLAEKNDAHSADILHVNDNLNAVFAKLSQPLQNLVWQPNEIS